MSDESLCEAIDRAERGIIDADLGGGLIKQRVARKGQGRSGGYRMILAYRMRDRAVFVFGFEKNERDNIAPDQLRRLRGAATEMLAECDAWIADSIENELLEEIAYG
jgi:hypothetical protein